MPSELVFIKQEKFDRQKYDIYFCSESEQFYLYQTKEGQFVEVDNPRLKNYLNKILQKKLKKNPEKLKQDIPQLCDKIKKEIILGNAADVLYKLYTAHQILLVSGLLISSTAPEITNYALIKTSNIVNSSNLIDATSSLDDFLSILEQTINNNSDFNKMEKSVINDGNKRFFNDWGYLFSTEQKNHILNKASKIDVIRTTTKELDGASGRYTRKEIRVNESKDLTTTSHEWDHLMVDKGSLISIGARSLYSFFKWSAIDEGINESVNMEYYCIDPTDASYAQQREDVLLLSLILGKEPILQSYASLDSSSSIIKAIPSHMREDLYDFIGLMAIDFDATIYDNNIAKAQINESFYSNKDEAYNKLFKSKFGKNYQDTILYKYALKNCNFFKDYVQIEQFDSFKKYLYKIPIEEAIRCSSLEELKDYTLSVGINIDQTPLKPYMFLCNTQEIEQAQNPEHLQELLYNKLINQGLPEDQARLMVYEEITEDTVKAFANLLLNRLNSLMAPEYDKACILRAAQNTFNNDTKFEFTMSVMDRLIEDNQQGVYHLFANSDIHYTSYNGNPSMSNLAQKYYEYVQSDRYVIIGNRIIIEMGIDDKLDNVLYGEQCVVTAAHDITDPEEIKKYQEMFKTSENKFCYIEVENMEYFDESLLKIYVDELKSSTDFLNYVPPTINF